MVTNLKQLRVGAGLSQKQLAEVVNVSQQSINKYENHEVEPSLETLSLIADYFETSIDFLVGRTDIQRRIEAVQSYDLNADEQDLIKKYRLLTEKDRKMIMSLAERLNG